MKKIYLLITMITIIGFSSCDDEINVDEMLNYPPTVMNVFPKTSVKIGDFDVRVVLVDGPGSPLSSATLTLKDVQGNQVFQVTEPLQGTADTVVVKGEDFDAASLGLGDYTLFVDAVDSKGNAVSTSSSFKIATQLYPANHAQMFIAGAFNGWGASEMQLVADNTWEIKEIDLDGGPFKLKNTPDWSDDDWGDSNCDKVMELTTGGGPNTECNYTGLVNIRFNDETLRYTVVPAVTFSTNLSGLYLLGSFNGFQGPEPEFTLVADHTWELGEVRLKEGDVFKFAEGPYFEGKNYGDAEYDGKAEEYGPNIVLPESVKDGFYKVTFNDKSLAYTITFVRAGVELFLVGGSTTAGWDPAQSIPFLTVGEKRYALFAYLTVADGFKFLEVQDWAGDWGADPANDGKVIQVNESNATVDTEGFYFIEVDLGNQTYAVRKTAWAVVGDATPGGWNNDTDMTYTGNYTWKTDVTLTGGEFKFRANDSLDINVGKGEEDNTLVLGGVNIASPGPGNYSIELILDPVDGYRYTISPL